MKVFSLKATAILVLMVLFSGCALHKPAGEYQTISPPEKFNPVQESKPSDVISKWWLKYRDETLNAIMAEVLENNTDIEQAYHRLSQAAAYSKGKSADMFPQLSINGSAKTEDANNNRSAATSYNVSLAASYEIDLWGKIRSAKQAANFRRTASLYDLQALYISITAQTAELYFKASEKKKAIFLAREKVRLGKENLEIATLNYEQGIRDTSAVYSARQSLASAENVLILEKAACRKLFHTLSILQNKYPELPENYSLPELNAFREDFQKGIPSDLLKNRPDIQKVLAEVTAADYEIGIAIANRFPSISLTASVGESRTDITGSMVTSTFTNIAGNLMMPILDWGKKRAEVKRVTAKFNETLYTYKKAVLNGFKEAEDAIVEYSAAELSFEQVRLIEINSQAALEQIKNKYSYGLTNYNSVIIAKNANLDAKNRLSEAGLDLLLKNISLVRAIGGKWMNEEINTKFVKEKG